MSLIARAISEGRRRVAAVATVLSGSRGSIPAGPGRPMAWEGGKVDPFDAAFTPARLSVNALNEVNLAEARWRAAWLTQNDPKVRGARESIVRRYIGAGPMVNPSVDGDAAGIGAERARELSEEIADWWEWFARAVDPSRTISLAEQLRTAERHYFATGEMLPRITTVPAFKGYPAMPALEMISTARLDLSPSGSSWQSGNEGVAEGHTVRQGVEYDAKNRVVAYHVLVADPADPSSAYTVNAGKTVRIPITEAVLRFAAEDHGQVRGVPLPIAVIRTSRDSRGYKTATMRIAQLMTAVSIVFKGVSPPKAQAGNESGAVDQEGKSISSWYEGQLLYLPQGRDASVELKGPTLPGNNFGELLRVYDRDTAKGLGLTYPTFSGDGAGETYAQRRAGLLEEQDASDTERKLRTLWVVDPLYESFVGWLVAMGHLKLTTDELRAFLADPDWLLRRSVVWPAYGWIDPLKEASAQKVALEIGATSRVRVALEAGADPRKMIDESIAIEVYERDQRALHKLPPKADPATAAAPAPDPMQPDPADGESPDPADQTDPADPPGPTPSQAPDAGGRMAPHLNGQTRKPRHA